MSEARTTTGWERLDWLFPAVWLVFLVYPVGAVLDSGAADWAKVLTLACLAAFAVVYVLSFGSWNRRPWWCAAALLALTAACVPVVGIEVLALAPFLGAYSALALPRPWWPWTTALVALVPVLAWLTADLELFYFLIVWPCLMVCALVRLLTETSDQRRAAADELALVAERERVARDVHDVLGHSLTLLSVKAELAARLVEVDPVRAREELESIQRTARQALSEVRLTVGGLRASSLTSELETAPTVLSDAGLEVRVLGQVADTDPQRRIVLAWVLREAVTNIVRHAGAGQVTIELGAHGMSVIDDGRGFPVDAAGGGNGLRGMRERVERAGGTLSVLDNAPGTRVQVVWP